METFIKSFSDFNDYETIFLCRNIDLKSTPLKEVIEQHAVNYKILGIEKNNLGPVYSVSNIFEHLPDDRPLLLSYIDTLQRTTIKGLINSFHGYDGGMTIHDFKNPHWRTSKSYCLVECDDNFNATNVVEKYDFKDEDFLDKHKFGSSGNYYFKSGALLKKYFNFILENNIKVNNEFYVTQAIEYMIKNKLRLKAYLCPYAALGSPEDLEDYSFWMRWFNDFNIS
jgi:bifunctional N-acetylglucosamine-1-phosphate-uridyltransferase/glucosamine-1-phosphate-acetyltransferase GlmU-like protein